MRFENFGKLVAALRRERRRTDSDGFMRQEDLATITGLSVETIGRIERGKRGWLQPDELTSLADAFNLLPGERREFFAAANGVDTRDLVGKAGDPQEALKYCLEMLHTIQAPAFIFDQFCDVIAVNKAIAEFYNLTQKRGDIDSVYEWINLPHSINTLDVLATPEANTSIDRRQFIQRGILHFRIRSLQYRHWPYFKILVRRLKGYLDFRRQWQNVEYYTDEYISRPIQIASERWEKLVAAAATITIPTKHGTLEIAIYSPLTSPTAQTFQELMEDDGNKVIRTGNPKIPPFD